MNEIVELKYNRHGSTLKKRKFNQPNNENFFSNDVNKIQSNNIASTDTASPARRVSLLFKNIDDNISEVASSKRNSLISNTSFWGVNPYQPIRQTAGRKSNLQNEIRSRPPTNAARRGTSMDYYQNLEINESRFGNPTENNFNLSDINEHALKNRIELENNQASNVGSQSEFYNQNDNASYFEKSNVPQNDFLHNRDSVSYEQTNGWRERKISRSSVIFDDKTSRTDLKKEFNKDYLQDMNIQLTPPNKNKSKTTKQSLEKNGLESFVEHNGSGYSYTEDIKEENISDDQIEIDSDDIDGGWATRGENYIQSKRYLELIKGKKLNLKDPVEQIDDPGDDEFDAERYHDHERNISSRNSAPFLSREANLLQKDSRLWDETEDVIKQNKGLLNSSGDDSSENFSDNSTNDEDYELSESEQTPITTDKRLRKSTRVKVPTLDFWRNEKIVYKKDPHGPGLTIDGVIKIDKKDDVHEEDFIRRRKTQTKTFTVDQGKKKRGRKKKIANDLGITNRVNYRIYEKIDAGEIPGSDWLKFGIFETEVKTDKNNTEDMVVAFAPDTASETVPTLTSYDDYTICYTLEKALSGTDVIKTGFYKLPIETGKKSKAKNMCKWLQFIVLNGVVEVKITNDDTQADKEDVMVCVKNSEFCIPTEAHYAMQNIGEDELQLNFTMLFDRNEAAEVFLKSQNEEDNDSKEISEDEEQEELSRFLDGNGEGSSDFSQENEEETEKQLFLESSGELS